MLKNLIIDLKIVIIYFNFSSKVCINSAKKSNQFKQEKLEKYVSTSEL